MQLRNIVIETSNETIVCHVRAIDFATKFERNVLNVTMNGFLKFVIDLGALMISIQPTIGTKRNAKAFLDQEILHQK